MSTYRPFFISLILLVLAGFAGACGGSKDSPSAAYTTISVQEAYQHIGENSSAVFIDVRNPEEWATGHPDGAILIPLSEFDQAAPAQLTDKNAEIYVICNSGNRSKTASQKLIDLGYTRVFNIDGGYKAWSAANLPSRID